MSASEQPAVVFEDVTKRYRLGGGPREQLLDAFGLSRFVAEKKQRQEFLALDDVTFQLEKGRRMGLIGRNGAGKTTLLKLISGNFRPSAGRVIVNGTVQALMTMGQGFHPDYTGRENIQASLHYNGLSSREVDDAFDDVVEFCELGPFLDQPFKTYSSGMQSRLMFGTATAIRPDILIIDEVLGAGDAYFLAKSKHRVDKIIANGCTLLLVSHSMQQVLELCGEAIWLDAGRVNLIGDALSVVKAYEKSLYGAMPGSGDPLVSRRRANQGDERNSLPNATIVGALNVSMHVTTRASPPMNNAENIAEASDAVVRATSKRLQVPTFIPHQAQIMIPPVPDAKGRTFHNEARSGLSRWHGSVGTKIVGFCVSSPAGPTNRIVSLQPAQMTIFLESEVTGEVAYTYGVAIHDLEGRGLCRFFSPPDSFIAEVGAGRRVDLVLNPNQLGPGIYTIGISIHEATTIENVNVVARYDLLARSFEIVVEMPDSLSGASAQFFHSCEWGFSTAVLPHPVECMYE
jgi:lipopolysaccharide transport system ATP-binding protein